MFKIIVLICLFVPSLLSAKNDIDYWIQYYNDYYLLRVLADDCEDIKIISDSKKFELSLRSDKDNDLTKQLCEVKIPKDIINLSIDEQNINLPGQSIKRIAIIGDTGCRNTHFIRTNCNDKDAWPLETIAKSIDRKKPDLIIHLGDYVYTQTYCILGGANCSNKNDIFSKWRKEFLDPANLILKQYPWIFIRGNHDKCSRFGYYWTKLFGYNQWNNKCNAVEDIFNVTLNNLRLNLIIADTANISDRILKNLDFYKKYISNIRDNTRNGMSNLLFMHHPVFEGSSINNMLFRANIEQYFESIDAFFGGHVHTIAVTNFYNLIPHQFVLGGGGANLKSFKDQNMRKIILPKSITKIRNDIYKYDIDLNYKNLLGTVRDIKAKFIEYKNFGFAILENINDSWVINIYNKYGEYIMDCKANGDWRSMLCSIKE